MKTPLDSAREEAFTLLEVVVTLTVAAVLATMLMVYLGRAFQRSADPAISLAGIYRLQSVIENIQHDSLSNALTVVSTRVGAEESNQNNAYGQYRVLQNHFISLTGGTEAPAPGTTNVLKVTVGNTTGARISLVLSH
jgi:prepilin-type N-terminal cleavage/methylation domain-containing protein